MLTWARKKQSRAEQCTQASHYYQHKFPEVTRMSWEAFFRLAPHPHPQPQSQSQPQPQLNEKLESEPKNENVDTTNTNDNTTTNLQRNTNVIVIDVRTSQEYNVSTIPGSVTLATFEQDILPNLCSSNDYDANANVDQVKVVTFCTIGYRSGMEARRLKYLYPHINISHLEGIVSYTHSQAPSSPSSSSSSSESQPQSQQHTNETKTSSSKSLLPLLVDPNTQQPTMKIHTFSKLWDYTFTSQQNQDKRNDNIDDYDKHDDDHDVDDKISYQSIYFSVPSLLFYMTNVGIRSLRINISHFFHKHKVC